MYSKRIRCIADCLPRCETLADIGCDHGYIGVSALESGKADRVVFSDISAPSLAKARALCEEKGLCGKAEFFVGDGTEKIDYADCVVIAGMGGRETVGILQKCLFCPSAVVLQPMKNLPEVRTFAAARYKIQTDKIVFDKKFYNIIVLTRGRDSLTEEELLFGRTNLAERSDDFKKYISQEKQKTLGLLAKKPDNDKMAAYLKKLTEIAEVLEI